MQQPLPIEEYREQIISSVDDNKITIVVAETGAGKSTQVPQFLLDHGYDVLITQPRRLAARELSSRVAQELDTELGTLVGYHIAGDKISSVETRCVFATDGLALVQELLDTKKRNNNCVLIIDELHEWNINIEILVALIKIKIKSDHNFRVVLMSATIEAEKLAAYLGGTNIINVKGRLFKVDTLGKGKTILDDVVKLATGFRNVLVFLPGKSEIKELMLELQLKNLDAEIIPLHGQQSASEQALAFKKYERPKVVIATNVAQTSITIDDMDAVVDSGLERRKEIVGGVEGLYLRPISLADSAQRKGRAGRTKPGVYIDHIPKNTVRSEYPVAEINRSHLDQIVLRLAIINIDMHKLELFHGVAKSKIQKAKQDLINLGCLDGLGRVTSIGKKIVSLPVSVTCGRILIEAEKRGCLKQAILAAAIIESGSIILRTDDYGNKSNSWKMHVGSESSSDILAQMQLFLKAENKNKSEIKSMGIHHKALDKARHTHQRLTDSVAKVFKCVEQISEGELLKSICAGMINNLYLRQGSGYVGADGVLRRLNDQTVIARPRLIVGTPFDLEVKTNSGQHVINLITMTSHIKEDWLSEIAGHLFKNVSQATGQSQVTEIHLSGVRVGLQSAVQKAV